MLMVETLSSFMPELNMQGINSENKSCEELNSEVLWNEEQTIPHQVQILYPLHKFSTVNLLHGPGNHGHLKVSLQNAWYWPSPCFLPWNATWCSSGEDPENDNSPWEPLFHLDKLRDDWDGRHFWDWHALCLYQKDNSDLDVTWAEVSKQLQFHLLYTSRKPHTISKKKKSTSLFFFFWKSNQKSKFQVNHDPLIQPQHCDIWVDYWFLLGPYTVQCSCYSTLKHLSLKHWHYCVFSTWQLVLNLLTSSLANGYSGV